MEQEHEKRAAALAGLLCAALTLAFVPASRADEPPQPNAPAVQAAEAPANRQDEGKRFVLTRSGEIVEGRLRDGGSAYLLEFDKGGSTLVSKLDALFIGKSRKDVFQYKLSQTRTEDLNEVLKLTDWASRRKLAPEAIELLESRLASTRDPRERNEGRHRSQSANTGRRSRPLPSGDRVCADHDVGAGWIRRSVHAFHDRQDLGCPVP